MPKKQPRKRRSEPRARMPADLPPVSPAPLPRSVASAAAPLRPGERHRVPDVPRTSLFYYFEKDRTKSPFQRAKNHRPRCVRFRSKCAGIAVVCDRSLSVKFTIKLLVHTAFREFKQFYNIRIYIN